MNLCALSGVALKGSAIYLQKGVRDRIKSIQFSGLRGIQVGKKYPPLKSLQTVACAWSSVKLVYQERVTAKDAAPGTISVIQTFGSSPEINPYSLVQVTECFCGGDPFRGASSFRFEDLEAVF